MLTKNLILNSDSYKMSHFSMYPPGTTNVYSYMESRGGKYEATIFYGLQGLLKEYLLQPVTYADVLEAERFSRDHGVPFNYEGWMKIVNVYGGLLPVTINAVAEGTLVDVRNVLMTVENNDPELPFITSYVETLALRLWYPITVATRVFNMKKKLKPFFDKSSETGFMDFAVLDFSARGCSSYETNMIGGSAYLTSFAGSDSMAAVMYAKKLYGGEVVGFSVPATEHSVMCSYGQENEFESFQHLIDIQPENGILSVVSDTWNIYEAAEKWVLLKDKIIKKNITLVVRPDSGHMREVLPKILRTLEDGFGYTVNSKGYHVLKNVKVLWGDGINEDTVTDPFLIATSMGISADSIMTGSGGGLMQANIDRDTNKFAFKASNITIDGVDHAIAKNPITDSGKSSKKGRMVLGKQMPEGPFFTYTSDANPMKFDWKDDYLDVVYENGQLVGEEVTMKQIRDRVNSYL